MRKYDKDNLSNIMKNNIENRKSEKPTKNEKDNLSNI